MAVDYKKVVKGLKKCSIDDVDCKHCPYNGEGNHKYGCETVMQREALRLLKKQKAIIEQYQKADTFLEVHGWEWKGR